ncbi:hypothetical protein LCGC14_3034240, partial [marine sediment metagenome]
MKKRTGTKSKILLVLSIVSMMATLYLVFVYVPTEKD